MAGKARKGKGASKNASGASQKRKKVTGGRGSVSRHQEGTDPRGVVGIMILCLGLLALASQFIPSGGGFLRQTMLFARGLGGSLCLLLPIVVCWAGVVLVFFDQRKMSVRTLLCGFTIFVLIETMFQLFQINAVCASLLADGQTPGYGSFLARSYRLSSLSTKGGGLIGALLAWPFYAALDTWGTMIVLIFALVIVLMVLTGASLSSVGIHVSEWADEFRVRMAQRREERDALRDVEDEKALERENEIAMERQKKRAERAKAEREAQEAEARRREEEAERLKAEQAAQQAALAETAAEPEPRAARRKSGQPELTVVRAEKEPDMPLKQNKPRRAAVQRQRKPIPEDMPLYIERSDEFTRDASTGRSGERTLRRLSFEEAGNAHYAGADASVSETADEVQTTRAYRSGPTYRPDMEYDRSAFVGADSEVEQDVEPAQQETYAEQVPCTDEVEAFAPSYESPAYEMPTYETPRYEVPMYDAQASAMQTMQAEQTEYMVQTDEMPLEENGVTVVEDVPDFWMENADMENEISADVSDDDAAETEAEDEIPTGSFGTWQSAVREPTRLTETPRFDAARSEAESMRAPKPTTAMPNAGGNPEQQTIVQLRGSRLDGTPIVMPAKDTHALPEAPKEEYVRPPFDLLNQNRTVQDPNQRAKDEEGARKLLGTLESFGVQAKLINVTHGPAITRYELQPERGVKVSRIVNLVDDIALNMASDGVRIEAPIPGKPAVGIEIPNRKTEMVALRDVLESPEMKQETSSTAVALGKGISGAPVVADMAKMPHVLIAGATGSGKSVCINTIINSIIYRASPKEVRLILIDPKVVELSVYNGIPHLLVPVVTDPKKASAALSWAVVEMEHRYKRFESMGVRDIRGYNKAIGPDEEPMSKIIVIIDELADLMMVAPGEVEESICRLAQLARAAGIHLVIATQRPSVNVITGVIKANIPSRIAFAVSSQIDSRTILDTGGAEKLLGKGDMLYAPYGAGKPTRVQGCFVSDDEVQRVVDFVRGKHTADYNEDVMEQMNTAANEDKAAGGDLPASGEQVDEMLAKAIELAVDAGQVSISMLQRRLRVGYARAGRLVDEMTLRGITAEAEGPTKPRTVLISREEWKRMQENQE